MSENEIDFVKSTKQKNLLVFNNFTFKMDYESKNTGKITWRCNEDSKCLARCSTVGFEPPVSVKNPDHSHPAKPARILRRKVINEMKENATQNFYKPRNCILY